MVVHRDWGGAPEPLCPSPGGDCRIITAQSCCSSRITRISSGTAPSLGCHPSPASPSPLCLDSTSPALPHPAGPGREFRDRRGICWHQVWDFLSFLKTLSFRCSFGRLNSLQTSLQLLFVTDFTPSIAFLLLEAEASWLETFPTVDVSSGSVWDSLLATQLLSHLPSVKDSPLLLQGIPGNPGLRMAAGTGPECPQSRGWTSTGTIPGAECGFPWDDP